MFKLERCSMSLSWRVPLSSVISVINTELLSETFRHQITLTPGPSPTVATVKQKFLHFAVGNQIFQVISFQFVRNAFFPPLQLKDFFHGSQQGTASLGKALISPVLTWPSQPLRSQVDPLLLTAWVVQLLPYRLKKVKISLSSLQNNHT